jgi:hypothetical protein
MPVSKTEATSGTVLHDISQAVADAASALKRATAAVASLPRGVTPDQRQIRVVECQVAELNLAAAKARLKAVRQYLPAQEQR